MQVLAHEFRQSGKIFYSFVVRHKEIASICNTVVFSHSDLGGDQRPVCPKHAKEFADDIRTKSSVRPQSIVANAKGFRVVEDIADVPNLKRIEFSELRLTDGQHGIKALDILDEEGSDHPNEWEWSVTALPDSPNEELQIIHAGINNHQKKADKNVNSYIEFKNDKLGDYKMQAGSVFDRLNKDEKSVLFGRVKCVYGDAVKNTLGFHDFVIRMIEDGGRNIFSLPCMQKKSKDEVYELVKFYYEAWAGCNEAMWNDRSAYFFGDKMGLKVLTRLMFDIFEKLSAKNKQITTALIYEVISSVCKKIHASEKVKRMWICDVNGNKSTSNKYHYGPEQYLYCTMRKLVDPKKWCGGKGKGSSRKRELVVGDLD